VKPVSLSALGSPLCWLYGAWIGRRNRRYDRPGASTQVSVPVVSIGNLSAGGTGKTPMVRWLAETMLAREVRTAIVSRGYGGAAGSGPVVVSSGDGPLCPAAVAGDEPWMLAHAVPGAVVVVGSNRTEGARKAIDLGARLILLDDGFQHRALARDLDVVLLDRSRPFDSDRLLPAGQLREPPSSLARADWIVVTRSPSAAGSERLQAAIRASNPSAPILHADHRPVGFFDAIGDAVPRPLRAVAFCAIGNPSRFRADLEGLGVSLAAFEPLRDHRRIGPGRLERLRARAVDQEAVLVTTEKDIARIGPALAQRFGVTVLAIRTRLNEGARLIEAIERLPIGLPGGTG
jgi:tetraacyldisaccharide 4'-kinase